MQRWGWRGTWNQVEQAMNMELKGSVSCWAWEFPEGLQSAGKKTLGRGRKQVSVWLRGSAGLREREWLFSRVGGAVRIKGMCRFES